LKTAHAAAAAQLLKSKFTAYLLTHLGAGAGVLVCRRARAAVGYEGSETLSAMNLAQSRQGNADAFLPPVIF